MFIWLMLRHLTIILGKQVVDLIITELAVFKVDPSKGLILTEHAPGVSVEDIQARTGAPFTVAADLKQMK